MMEVRQNPYARFYSVLGAISIFGGGGRCATKELRVDQLAIAKLQTSKSDFLGNKPIKPYVPMITDTASIPPTKQASKKCINLQLIKCCALLASSKPARALESVEEALLVAEEKNLFYEISKCYLYRGLCFMGLKRWREARVAFVRGVNVRGWAGRVEGLMREAQGHVDEERKLMGKKGKA